MKKEYEEITTTGNCDTSYLDLKERNNEESKNEIESFEEPIMNDIWY